MSTLENNNSSIAELMQQVHDLPPAAHRDAVLRIPQAMTETQKWQARANIDAISRAEVIQQTPAFANSVEECTDTSKVYVLPDGFIYAHDGTGWKNTNIKFIQADNEHRIVALELTKGDGLYFDKNTKTLYLTSSGDIVGAGVKISEDNAVLTTEQDLRESEKAQARENIGIEDTIIDMVVSLDLAPVLLNRDGSALIEDDYTLLLT